MDFIGVYSKDDANVVALSAHVVVFTISCIANQNWFHIAA